MIRLTNKKKTMVQFNLPHEHCCSGALCFCTTKEFLVHERDRSGSMVQRYREQRMAGSLLLSVGGVSEPLADAVLRSPDIARAVAARELLVTSITA